MLDYEIHGGKGGGKKPHTPVETPNNLLSVAYAKILLAVAEGELAGTPTAQDIYLDGTPLANPDGTLNFGGVKWEWRSGSQDQEYIAGVPDISTEFNVGVELRDITPWTRLITKTSLDAIRLTFQWPALLEQAENGDTNGYSMKYAVDISTDGGPFQLYQEYDITGKTNTAYERTHRIELPKSTNGWTVRARRVTPESTSSRIQDTINLKSYTEVVDRKQRYPNTALLFVEFDSRAFGGGNIPKVSVKTKGRTVQVPSNYNPEARTYSGVWDGSFKWAWTNNPAWVFYDLVTQNRFGLGHKVDATMVDRIALYEVSQYCDVMVDDGTGSGNKKPRHTCNVYIQEQADAWQVLRDIATIFNGMTYWNGNQFVAIADKQEPLDNLPIFSRSNVVGGTFDYQSTDDKSIYTSAVVSYDDPEDHYRTQVEAVWEKSEILRWGGDRKVELSAIGCTDRGEAQRKGRYTLLTNMFNRTVKFQTGLQGLNDAILPGKLINVLDPLIGGRDYTGRIKIATGRVITLDRPVEATAGDLLFLTKKDGTSEARTVQAVSGNVVTVTTAYSEQILPNAVWYHEAQDLKSQIFRVTKITMPAESVFEIEAVEYNDSKYGAIDNGARLESRPVSVVPPGVQGAPESVNISASTYTEQTLAVTTMTVSWPQTLNATTYEGQWRVGNGDWVELGTTGALEFNVKGIYTGSYVARIRAVNALGVKSVWTYSAATQLNGKVGGVKALASLTTVPLVFGIRVQWEFPEGAEDTARTEIMYSQNTNFAQAQKLGDYSYPTDMHEMHGLKAGQQFWFWGRLVDRTGNIGPWTPLETAVGVAGSSSVDQTEYEEYFKEQITESALYKELNDRIDLIDGPPTLPGSVNNRLDEVSDQLNTAIDETNTKLEQDVAAINQSITDLSNQVDTDVANLNQSVTDLNTKVNQDVAALNQEIASLDQDITNVNTTLTTQINNVQQNLQSQIDAIDMSNTLPYDPTMTYTTAQVVLGADRKLYQAKQNVPLNQAPPNSTYWLDIGSAVITADGLAARVTKTEQDVTNLDGRVTANSTSITGLQTQINGKADASAVQSLTTRVTTAEGKIETNAQAITGLQTTVAGKADTSAVNALTTRVSTAEGKIDANTSAITNLTTTVNGKADASAVNALSTRVTTAEGKIDANTSAITGLTASIGNIAGNGTNLLPAEYTVFGSTLPAMSTSNVGVSVASEADTSTFNGSALKMTTSNTVTTTYVALAPGITYPTVNIALQKQKYIVSYYAKASDAGHQMATYLRTLNSAGANVNTSQGLVTLTTDWVRYTSVLDTTGATIVGDKMALMLQPNRSGVSGRTVWVDRIMIEPQVGAGTNASPFTPGTSFGQATANAAATQSLTVRVTQTENDIAAQAQQITNLTTTVAGKADTSAVNALTTRVTTAEGKIDANTTAITNLTTTVNGKADASSVTALTARVTTAEGKIDANTTAITNLTTVVNGKADASAVNSLTTRVTTAEGKIDANTTAITNLTTTVNGKADASALTALTTRVTTVEGTVTSQGQSITSLNNSLGNIAGAGSNLLNSTYSWLTSTTLPTMASQLVTLTGVAVPESDSGFGYQMVTTSNSVFSYMALAPSNNVSGYNMTLEPGTYLVSMYIKGSAAGTARANLYDGTTSRVADVNYTTTRTRYVFPIVVNASAKSRLMVYPNRQGSASPVTVVVDSVMVEKKLGNGEAASPFVAGSTAPAVTANAQAITSLTTRVSNAEGTISSQAQQITNLTTQINGKADASAVTALSNRVTSVEGTVTSQGQAITSLTNRVTTAEGTIAGQATAISDLQTTVTDVNGKVSVLVSSIDSLTAAYRDNDGVGDQNDAMNSWNTLANVTESRKVFADEQIATAERFSSVDAKLGENSAAVTSLEQAVATQNSANALKFDSLTAGVQSNSASITTLSETVATQNSANASRFTQIESSVTVAQDAANSALTQVGTKADASAVDALTTRVTNVEGTVTSQGQSLTQLTNRVTTAEGTISGQATAITNLQTTVTQQGTDITAQTTRLDGIYAQVNPEMVGDSSVLIGRSTKLVGIWTEQSARVEGDVAIGTSVTNLQAQMGENTAAIQQVSSVATSLNDKTQAMWSVKMNVNAQGQYVAAGIGLGIENGPAGLQSTFLVQADKFAVVNGVNGNVTAPFVVTGGQVFIREALITKAMIANLMVGNAINSETVAAWAGLPATVITLAGEGAIVMRHLTRANTYTTYTPSGVTVVVDGVVRVRMGTW